MEGNITYYIYSIGGLLSRGDLYSSSNTTTAVDYASSFRDYVSYEKDDFIIDFTVPSGGGLYYVKVSSDEIGPFGVMVSTERP